MQQKEVDDIYDCNKLSDGGYKIYIGGVIMFKMKRLIIAIIMTVTMTISMNTAYANWLHPDTIEAVEEPVVNIVNDYYYYDEFLFYEASTYYEDDDHWCSLNGTNSNPYVYLYKRYLWVTSHHGSSWKKGPLRGG